ncbi:glycerol-3-phosphate acyltransferase PlsY [Sulfobacillus thermosulfidooxidans DSM 9293]|uniref:Glycerol-3-phosphate acyltransferase n=1 Tax=Sulfobacillus thermosulfidooxidans (strain DSM 9293 / VKM B-1269 / AT-1) TaxID=929705 RepID=A0A1W1WGU1_SULTA|nr:glycerol-3-phosphate 1-O-acyltransferase PlsY [Sulfobacillus thermosulfidooxidans]SMC05476.1 glycerol-3-phosphate acyltransferase PlsY [Sulfobacillus thermosulfidooxidans DSM 9293]
MPVPEAVVVLIGSFLLGSIPFGYLMARMRFQTDIRQHGSQNIGATNVARTFGIRVGLVVLVLDALKGILAVMMAFVLFPHSSLLPAASGLMAMLGHVFSPFMKFKGGKGIATGLGVLSTLFWPAALIAVLCFALVVVLSRIVSVASFVAMLAALVSFWAFGQQTDFWFFGVPAVILAFWAHRNNWRRLLKGQEPRFGR